ncbi:MAG: hypothetical protein MZW92_19070 [Comamonadaceae bacterium]|nr:hypothetical protein [Comamonadaceae bacterium]
MFYFARGDDAGRRRDGPDAGAGRAQLALATFDGATALAAAVAAAAGRAARAGHVQGRHHARARSRRWRPTASAKPSSARSGGRASGPASWGRPGS